MLLPCASSHPQGSAVLVSAAAVNTFQFHPDGTLESARLVSAPAPVLRHSDPGARLAFSRHVQMSRFIDVWCFGETYETYHIVLEIAGYRTYMDIYL